MLCEGPQKGTVSQACREPTRAGSDLALSVMVLTTSCPVSGALIPEDFFNNVKVLSHARNCSGAEDITRNKRQNPTLTELTP